MDGDPAFARAEDASIAPPADAPEPNPIATLLRAMRGRWLLAAVSAVALGGAFGAAGYLSGAELYRAQAILRVFPQEANILYATGDGSVLKTFDSFVKAETTYVASHPVMGRALEILRAERPDRTAEIGVSDLTGSIEIRRSDSLIVLSTLSREAAFASDKLEAVVAAYMALTAETEEARSAVRLAELHRREGELLARLEDLRTDKLEIGGEYGVSAIARAHVEKIAQIEALDLRLSEVRTTLAGLEAQDGVASVDTSNQEIMRATLLDRTMADLGFERAKLLSGLAELRAGLAGDRLEQAERARLEAIAVIEEALADRREQIRILGQTGALTDATAGGSEASTAEIRALRTRLEDQIAEARAEARDLNQRRVALDRVEREVAETEDLLEETRHALEVIRLESGRALPGYTVLMSPPSEPQEPAENSRRMQAALGLVAGAGLALALVLGRGLLERRLRFAETLAPVAHRVPVLQVSAARDDDPEAADRLRGALQVQPLRAPRRTGRAPVIAVVRGAAGETSALARALAEAHARARLRTLFIEADLGVPGSGDDTPGWGAALLGAEAAPVDAPGVPGLRTLGAGGPGGPGDRAVSAPMVRAALERHAQGYDAVIVSAGSLTERLCAPLVLAAADLGVLAMHPDDRRAAVLRQIDRLDGLPRNGSVAVLREALAGDPWLAERT
jgi:uncharacterized protein involved in exopolysaccharide biosynthesis